MQLGKQLVSNTQENENIDSHYQQKTMYADNITLQALATNETQYRDYNGVRYFANMCDQ